MDHPRFIRHQRGEVIMIEKEVEPLPAIETLSLFPKINKELIALLKSLSPTEWHLPTVLPGRTVKDLASHILDSSLRRLSSCRDNYQVNANKFETNEDLVRYIQDLNQSWIDATQRLSPQILIFFLEFSERWLVEYFKTLDLNGTAKFPVSWAGQWESQNWFDMAREYTEKWHHQMQIRLAVNKPGINSKELFHPVIDCFMRGLPHAYHKVNAEQDVGIEIEIKGEGGGVWFLEKMRDHWCLVKKLKISPKAKIEMTDQIAWQLFTDSISRDSAAKETKMFGIKALAEPILSMRTVLR